MVTAKQETSREVDKGDCRRLGGFLKLGGLVGLAAGLLVVAPLGAQAGECTSGQCGTPNQSGGGCGCGCGSILVAMTDRGDTYQFADDFDGDGIEDEFDSCPFAANVDQADADGDAVGDACDNCIDVANPGQANLDGNDAGDACDPDDDGDGYADAEDTCPAIPNVAQADFDGDGRGDLCDADDDGDGVKDIDDDCRLGDANDPGAECTADADGDGIPRADDNCPSIANPLQNGVQPDTDGDGKGDACDQDIDNDGVENAFDNCISKPNPSQVDVDRDGVGDNGNFTDGPGSCDFQECYVIGGDAESCLNPEAAFDIRLSSFTRNMSPEILVGDQVGVALFSNRLEMPHSWTARLEKVPAGSQAKLIHAEGVGSTGHKDPQVVNCLRVEEGVCTETNHLRFEPDVPGEYLIEVSATLPQGDPKELGVETTTSTLSVDVAPADDTAPSGCAAGGASAGAIVLGSLAALLSAVRRRKRA